MKLKFVDENPGTIQKYLAMDLKDILKVEPGEHYRFEKDFFDHTDSYLFQRLAEQEAIFRIDNPSARRTGDLGVPIVIVSANSRSYVGDTYSITLPIGMVAVSATSMYLVQIGKRINLHDFDSDRFPLNTWGIVTDVEGDHFVVDALRQGAVVETGITLNFSAASSFRNANFPGVANRELPYSTSCFFTLTEEARASRGYVGDPKFQYLGHDYDLPNHKLVFYARQGQEVITFYGEEVRQSKTDHDLDHTF